MGWTQGALSDPDASAARSAAFSRAPAGAFPNCERIVGEVLSLPVHEFITRISRSVVGLIESFYRG
jgi:hypothetical protein